MRGNIGHFSQDFTFLCRSQFHVMRDGPFHITTILAGLWGGNNYVNFTRALEVRRKLLDVEPNQWKFFDQKILNTRIWPAIRKLKYSNIFPLNVGLQELLHCS